MSFEKPSSPGSLPLLKLQQWTDSIAALYFLLTAAIVWFHRAQFPHWKAYLSVHLVATTGLWLLRRFPLQHLPGVIRFFRDWYPALLFPVLYKEVEQFALAFGDWKLTESIQQLEVAVFSGHPSLYVSRLYPWAALSEYLHFCYFVYLLLLPAVGGWWYFNGRRRDFQELLLLVSATLFSSYLFYMSYPVDSPFYLFKPLEAPLGHWILLSARPLLLGARRCPRWRFPKCARFGVARDLAGCVAAPAARGLGLGPGDRRIGWRDGLRKVSLCIRCAGRTSSRPSGHGMLPLVPTETSRLTTAC